MMKSLLIVVSLLVAIPEEANAYACHAGVYRSGCVSRYGATIRRHPARYGANRCHISTGGRVCY